MGEFLQGVFRLSQGSRSKYNVTVSTKYITYQRHEAEKANVYKMCLDDVVGCEILRSKDPNSAVAFLSIYAYVHKKKFARASSRQRQVLSLEFSREKTYEENAKNAAQWRAVLLAIIRGEQLEGRNFSGETDTGIVAPKGRRMLVLVNPFSGPGKAPSIFQEKVAPMLKEAGISFNLMVTEYAGHAKSVVMEVDLSQFYGIVIVSGDGLLYEVVNGLMERPDWATAIQTPLGVVPGGSGNALSCSINSAAGEPYLQNHILHATFLLVRHVYPRPMDLVAVDLCNGQRLYSFLAVAWGMISDVDIESERFRRLGSARFTLGAFVRIVGLRKYRGVLSFLPVDPYPPPNTKHLNKLARAQSVVPSSSGSAQLLSRRSHSVVDGWSADQGDTAANFEGATVQGNHQRGSVAGRLPSNIGVDLSKDLNLEQADVELPGVHGEHVNTDQMKQKSLAEELQEAAVEEKNSVVFEEGHTPSDSTKAFDASAHPKLTVPRLNEPVPENWITITDTFVTVCASYQSHLSYDYIPELDRGLHTGSMLLNIVRHGASRVQITRSMLAAADGQRITSDNFEAVRVKAFRLVPESKDGILTVDGEKVAFGPIQGEVLPGYANIMA